MIYFNLLSNVVETLYSKYAADTQNTIPLSKSHPLLPNPNMDVNNKITDIENLIVFKFKKFSKKSNLSTCRRLGELRVSLVYFFVCRKINCTFDLC